MLLKTKLSEDALAAALVCNNNSLLIENLTKLFRDEKAKYLPYVIIVNIEHRISDINNLLDTIEKKPEDPGSVLQVLKSIDDLYAFCLQFGLITFGFTGKEEAQLVQGVRNKIGDIQSDISNLKQEISNNITKVDHAWQELEKN